MARDEADDTDLSLRDELLAARDAIETEQDPTEGAAPAEPSAIPAEPARPAAAADNNAARQPRGERGRFAPKEPTAPIEPAAEPTAAAAAADAAAAAQPAAGGAAPTGPLLAPNGWTTAEKAEWSKLTPAAQAAVLRREADFHRELTKQDPERNLGRQFIQAAQPFQTLIERSGKHPVAAFTEMMQIMQTMAMGTPQQKLALLREAAVRNGLDFRALVGMPPANGAPAPSGANGAPSATPPPVQGTPIPPALIQMGREWNEFKAGQAREAQEKQQREQEATMSEIMAFRAKPEARFFDQVKDTMVALLQAEAAQTLQEAYDQAIWARPDIRAVLEQERTTAANTAAAAAARAKAARVRGGSVRGSGGSTPPPSQENRSLRQELEEGFAQARARL